jgi:hypothetical protein
MRKVSISIRISHPTWPAENITRLLTDKPEISRTVGEPRTTPKGQPLEGINRETHWIKSFDYSGESVSKAIAAATNRYALFKDAFHEIRETGGGVEFFIGWFFERNGGDVIPADLLRQVGDLGIDLSFDVYGSE